MKCRLLIPMPAAAYVPDDDIEVVDGVRTFPRGAVIENPEAYKLVHGGIAEAMDDECRRAAARCPAKTRGGLRANHEHIMRELEDARDEMRSEEIEDRLS